MLPLAFILKQKPPIAEQKQSDGSRDTASFETNKAQTSLGLSLLTVQITLAIASVGCCVAMALPLAHMVAHVSDLGYDYATGARLLSLMLATAGISAFFGVGFLGRRYGGLKTIFIFSAIQGFFLFALIFADDIWMIYVVAIFFGIGYGGVLPCYPVIVREFLPASQVGRRTALVIVCASGGMALGSWLGGALYDTTGSYSLAFTIGVGFNIFNLFIIGYLIHRNSSRKDAFA
jgi:MFS family permease